MNKKLTGKLKNVNTDKFPLHREIVTNLMTLIHDVATMDEDYEFGLRIDMLAKLKTIVGLVDLPNEEKEKLVSEIDENTSQILEDEAEREKMYGERIY